MKYLKHRSKFINEAKIRDVIFPKQAAKVKDMWGEKYLDYEEIIPTENIKQGKWKLDEADKLEALGVFFDTDMKRVFKIFEDLPDKFAEILKKSINLELFSGEEKEKNSRVLSDFNIKSPSINQIVNIYDNIFRKLTVGETMADEVISRDASGRPLKDAENKIIKVKKEVGDPI